MDRSQIKKLNKLNDLRLKRQEKKIKQAKLSYIEACKKVENRNTQINDIKGQKQDLTKYLKIESNSKSPIKREYVQIRRFWLNYDLEMHEYYLEQELDERSTNHKNYQSDKKIWHKQKLKTEKLSELYVKSCKQHNSLIENREDEVSQEHMVK
ncbi:MAG: hypothetical protein JAY90_18400 [Candidatus Thiodiazotropha lotti]|nr:hypothetical protein [Candidatus Thiodiazotropha lotti]